MEILSSFRGDKHELCLIVIMLRHFNQQNVIYFFRILEKLHLLNVVIIN